MIEHLIVAASALLVGAGAGAWFAHRKLEAVHEGGESSGRWLHRKHWLAGAALPGLLLGVLALAPSLTGSAQPELAAAAPPDVRDMPPGCVNQIGRSNFAFAIAVDRDDAMWFIKHPATRHREREWSEGYPNPVTRLATVEIGTFDAKSHCYPVTMGGKPQEFCPQH